jgi:hypothetical protein
MMVTATIGEEMRATEEIRWLELAATLCARSAVAYKAAFLLAGSTPDERDYLGCCTRRYALLERLLGELQMAVGAASLRDVALDLDADPACYADSGSALAAALAGDRALDRALAQRPGRKVSARTPGAARASRPMAADASA